MRWVRSTLAALECISRMSWRTMKKKKRVEGSSDINKVLFFFVLLCDPPRPLVCALHEHRRLYSRVPSQTFRTFREYGCSTDDPPTLHLTEVKGRSTEDPGGRETQRRRFWGWVDGEK